MKDQDTTPLDWMRAFVVTVWPIFFGVALGCLFGWCGQ